VKKSKRATIFVSLVHKYCHLHGRYVFKTLPPKRINIVILGETSAFCGCSAALRFNAADCRCKAQILKAFAKHLLSVWMLVALHKTSGFHFARQWFQLSTCSHSCIMPCFLRSLYRAITSVTKHATYGSCLYCVYYVLGTGKNISKRACSICCSNGLFVSMYLNFLFIAYKRLRYILTKLH